MSMLEINVENELFKNLIAESQNEEHLRQRAYKRGAEDVLTDLGVQHSLVGYDYLVSAICIIIDNPQVKLSVCKDLYPTIAKKHDTIASRVERGIRHAIEVAVDKMNTSTYLEVFKNVDASRDRPTNSEFMFRVAQLVERRVEDSSAT